MRWTIPTVALLLSGACISEDAFNEVVAERDASYETIKTLEDELDVCKGKVAELEKFAKKAQDIPTRPPPAKVNAVRTQLKLDGNDILKARFETSMGDIVCDLYPNIAPETVLNFAGLAEGTKEWTEPETGKRTLEPLYDGTKFHRVIDGFMIQGGDPTGTGKGGPGYRFGDEVWPDVRFDKSGILAMANSGPNTNGSQFFITAVPTPHLNGRHTIFGQCEVETVREMMKVPVEGSRPTKDVILKKVHIIREDAADAEVVGEQGPTPGADVPESPVEPEEGALTPTVAPAEDESAAPEAAEEPEEPEGE